MAAIRAVLIGVGVVGLVFSAWTLMHTVSTHGIIGLALWLAAAIVLHDGILSPLVFAGNRLLRGVGRRIPPVVLAIAQGAIVVGVIFTLIVAPEIEAKHIGARNSSVVPFDYAMRLGLLWATLAVVTAITCIVVLRFRHKTATSALSA